MDSQVPQLKLSQYEFPLQAFIGGKFVDSTGNDKRTFISAVNDEIVTKELQWSNSQDVDLAVEAAEKGLQQWKSMSREHRRDTLIRFGALIKDNQQQLHWLEAFLVGKDAGFSNFEIRAAADLFILSNLKSVTTELGGKSPFIVFPDADLDGALKSATVFLIMNGQGCALGTRLYLHESIADAFVDKLSNVIQAHAKGLCGDPMSQTTLSSPLYHHRQRATVIVLAVEKDAKQRCIYSVDSGLSTLGQGTPIHELIAALMAAKGLLTEHTIKDKKGNDVTFLDRPYPTGYSCPAKEAISAVPHHEQSKGLVGTGLPRDVILVSIGAGEVAESDVGGLGSG